MEMHDAIPSRALAVISRPSVAPPLLMLHKATVEHSIAPGHRSGNLASRLYILWWENARAH